MVMSNETQTPNGVEVNSVVVLPKRDQRKNKVHGRKGSRAERLQKQGKVLTGVKFDGRADSKVIVGERKVRSTAGVKFDPTTHKKITHVFKQAAPLDARFADLSAEELKTEMKKVIGEIKDMKKSGTTAEEIAAKKAELKEMKRAQDSVLASTTAGQDNPVLLGANEIAA